VVNGSGIGAKGKKFGLSKPCSLFSLEGGDMTIQQTVYAQRDEILSLAHKYGAYNVRLFGSVARHEDTSLSDVDLLVDMEPQRSLLDRIGLLQELEAMLGCRVDVVTAQALHWSIREQVLAEAVPL
jgi:hypothetical protein